MPIINKLKNNNLFCIAYRRLNSIIISHVQTILKQV